MLTVKKSVFSSILWISSLCASAKIIDHTCFDKDHLPCGYTSMNTAIRNGSCMVYPDGEVGGYVANTAKIGTLDGDAVIPYIDRSSSVCGNAIVSGDVSLLLGSRVYNTASITGKQIQMYGGEVSGMATISGRNIKIHQTGIVHGTSIIRGQQIDIKGQVHGPSEIIGSNIVIEAKANIHGNSRVSHEDRDKPLHIWGELKGRSFAYETVPFHMILGTKGFRHLSGERDLKSSGEDEKNLSCLNPDSLPCGFQSTLEASEHGSCFINDDGSVGGYLSDKAKIISDPEGQSLLMDKSSSVCGSPYLSGKISLKKNASLGGKARLHGEITVDGGKVSGKAIVHGKVLIRGVVHGLTRIGGFQVSVLGHVHGHSQILGNHITVGESGHVYGRTRISHDPGNGDILIEGETFGRVTFDHSLSANIIKGPNGEKTRSKKSIRESISFSTNSVER